MVGNRDSIERDDYPATAGAESAGGERSRADHQESPGRQPGPGGSSEPKEALPDDTDAQRYAVGIDLGTTNCVLAWVDRGVIPDGHSPVEVHTMQIPQLTRPGTLEHLTQLPSFLYQAADTELEQHDIALPWGRPGRSLPGVLARHLGAATPLRLVSSAKSWLGQPRQDCRHAFLPLNAPSDVERISPLTATVRYLEYLRDAWDHEHPDAPLAEQDVVITVPASFDPAARDLTVEAAHTVGLHRLSLLEEPLAAMYHWLHAHGNDWRKQVTLGDLILVVDIGGGTTDLSLLAVTEEEGNLALRRIAVGNHILLGGDNMDLALVYQLRARLASDGKTLQPWQLQALVHECRRAKERLLGNDSIDRVEISVPSRGSNLFGATLRVALTREDITDTLLEGFLPGTGITDHPQHATRRALTQLTLPYAQDPAITRHLAAFLTRQVDAVPASGNAAPDPERTFATPTAVLFNGGVFRAPQLPVRLVSILNRWLETAGAPAVRTLQGGELDLAVARGAAFYSSLRRGKALRIRGGLASAYYVGIESAMPAVPGMEAPLEALCVAPFGMEEGNRVAMRDHQFGLVTGEPVRFRFFGSTSRRGDQAGDILDFWQPDELGPLPEIQATLEDPRHPPGTIVPVHLETAVTETGTLQLEAVASDGARRWQIEFDIRNTARAAETAEDLDPDVPGDVAASPGATA